ncbi:MAG: efflux RND transporter periplasmic adaptor subunit [Colwellia sp.]
MTNKKRIILPIIMVALGILAFVGFSSMKKPPEEKPKVDNTPIVSVESIIVSPMSMEVSSHGIIKPKYETTLVAQVTGEITELSPVFERGGFVEKGQLLAKIDPNDYQAALIEAQASMATARAALEQEVAHGKVAKKEWDKITDTSPTELSLRKPQLAKELARVKSAQAAVLRAERNLQRTEIRSPYDAMIESRDIGLGAFVSKGQQVGKLFGTAIAEVRLPVADNQLQYLVEQGRDAQVKLMGSFSGQEVEWQAKIIRNEGVVDNKSRMGYLVAQIKDPYNLGSKKTHQGPLRFGSYVKAKVIGLNVESAAIIPRHLVVEGKVAILDADLKLHYAKIDVIRQQGPNVIVANGLAHGDQLIVSALDYPVDGMQLALLSVEDEVEEGDEAEEIKTQIASNDGEGE